MSWSQECKFFAPQYNECTTRKDNKILISFGTFSQTASQLIIEDWEVERKTLVLEEQEMLKATKTFFVQSNLLLNFCKDCHSAFLKGNAEQKRKIVKMVCSNFSYDGSNIVIEPNPIFKAVIKNGLCNKKLPEKFCDATFINSLYSSIVNTSMDFFYKLQGFSECV